MDLAPSTETIAARFKHSKPLCKEAIVTAEEDLDFEFLLIFRALYVSAKQA